MMSRETQKRISTVSRQGEGTGTGLGLSTVYGIREAIGKNLVYSEESRNDLQDLLPRVTMVERYPNSRGNGRGRDDPPREDNGSPRVAARFSVAAATVIEASQRPESLPNARTRDRVDDNHGPHVTEMGVLTREQSTSERLVLAFFHVRIHRNAVPRELCRAGESVSRAFTPADLAHARVRLDGRCR